MLTRIPDKAIITDRCQGTIDAPGEPNHGKRADIRWYTYGIPSGITYYVDVYVDGQPLLRKSATGRNVAKWRKCYEEMCELVTVQS